MRSYGHSEAAVAAQFNAQRRNTVVPVSKPDSRRGNDYAAALSTVIKDRRCVDTGCTGCDPPIGQDFDPHRDGAIDEGDDRCDGDGREPVCSSTAPVPL